jgi:integrase
LWEVDGLEVDAAFHQVRHESDVARQPVQLRDEEFGAVNAARGQRCGENLPAMATAMLSALSFLRSSRHLRAAEVVDLGWEQVDFAAATLAVVRVKKGTPSTHPLRGNELRALRQLQRESAGRPFLFVSERGAPFTTAGFVKMVQRAGESGAGKAAGR